MVSSGISATTGQVVKKRKTAPWNGTHGAVRVRVWGKPGVSVGSLEGDGLSLGSGGTGTVGSGGCGGARVLDHVVRAVEGVELGDAGAVTRLSVSVDPGVLLGVGQALLSDEGFHELHRVVNEEVAVEADGVAILLELPLAALALGSIGLGVSVGQVNVLVDDDVGLGSEGHSELERQARCARTARFLADEHGLDEIAATVSEVVGLCVEVVRLWGDSDGV
ncbi:hypothetical protein CMI47_00900 [Candidatus Pacearchaeota archaeon]|nr:hypothetical protein [Candidatus Pacearchaeota archaeon]